MVHLRQMKTVRAEYSLGAVRVSGEGLRLSMSPLKPPPTRRTTGSPSTTRYKRNVSSSVGIPFVGVAAARRIALINTGRGGLIHEDDLLTVLEQGLIGGAALDVLSVEPPPPDHPLYRAPRCMITPHLAWASLEARQRLMEITIATVRAFLEGKPQHVVV